jgi:hypothetical protein
MSWINSMRWDSPSYTLTERSLRKVKLNGRLNNTIVKMSKKGIGNNMLKTIPLASVEMPKFKKQPLVSIGIGGCGFKPYYEKEEETITLGIFGIYISFRRSVDKKKIWVDGLKAGFETSEKVIFKLNEKIMIRESIIKKMAMLSGMKFVSKDPNDPFSPNGTLYTPQEEEDEEDDDDSFGFKPGLN